MPTTSATTSAVLLMAYGTPETPEQAEAYFTHIRGGRVPSPEAVAHLRARYARIGGSTPLLRVTRDVAAKLEAQLEAEGLPRRVYVGMKHWHPYIADTMREMRADGVRDVLALALAPHYSRMSVGAYHHTVVETNRALGEPFAIRGVDRWHDRAEFGAMMAGLVEAGLSRFPADRRASVAVVFTAHSLPVRIRTWDDPYERELLGSAGSVAARVGLGRWHFAWQSAGGTAEPWLGPDILDYLDELRADGVRDVLQVPIGFVSDHLEVLYDIDIEARERARALGMTLERTELPNARPELVRTLAAVVHAAHGDGALSPATTTPVATPVTMGAA